VKLAREAVADFARTIGASPEQLHRIRLAVSEAFTNAVIHAYEEPPGEVGVLARLASGGLRVIVADEGCGFQKPTPRRGHGWGMPLIAHSSSEFAIRGRSGGGTEVRMSFALGG
jgi:anti-sigma regulatory factor (Ser/Thr protein kinase)